MPTPFRLHVPDASLADLRDRLARTRLPEQPPGEPWATGTDVGWLADLIGYWRETFDWRAEEAKLNALPQFTEALHGIDLHYLHVPGVGPAPMPLLLLHGWPGSVFEFLDIIPRLTDPARFGGDPAHAFTVIAPSLPGYGLSFRPGQPRFGVEQIADCMADLMSGLGHDRFAVQGGDWGASIGSSLAVRHAARLIGLHLNLLMVRRDALSLPNMTEEERRYAEKLAHFMREETGYQWIQGTKPQTLAFALTDSPAGLAAWIGEKFRTWTDCDGLPENAVSRDRMLANIALYWFTGAIGSSFWPYYARHHGPWPIPDGQTVAVPVGYAAFPREIISPPRSVAARFYSDIRRWSEMPRGGHFAALEQPEALAQEISAFFAMLR